STQRRDERRVPNESLFFVFSAFIASLRLNCSSEPSCVAVSSGSWDCLRHSAPLSLRLRHPKSRRFKLVAPRQNGSNLGSMLSSNHFLLSLHSVSVRPSPGADVKSAG